MRIKDLGKTYVTGTADGDHINNAEIYDFHFDHQCD